MYSLTSPFFFSALPCSSGIIDRWTIELGDIAGGRFPIWPQSDDFELETLVVVATSLVLALLLSLFQVLPSAEENMHKLPSKTAETPAKELPFPGRLVEGKYDVQYLHL